MAGLARSLYEDGLGPREVLRRCYGVPFPEEVFVVAEAEPASKRILAQFTNQPWQLAVPPDRGGPAATPDSMAEVEREILGHDPNLLPLARCINLNFVHGGWVLCYALDELAAGRSTVVGFRDNQVTRRGDSLLPVLHEHHAAYAAWVARAWEEAADSHDNLVDSEQVGTSRLFLERIETLRRELASRTGDSSA